MVSLARQCFRRLWSSVTFHHPQTAPEPVNPRREMVGLFAHLTDEQKAAARAYNGQMNHGDPNYRAKKQEA